jgi:hypothetical protein
MTTTEISRRIDSNYKKLKKAEGGKYWKLYNERLQLMEMYNVQMKKEFLEIKGGY